MAKLIEYVVSIIYLGEAMDSLPTYQIVYILEYSSNKI